MARFEETQDLRGVNLDIGEQRARMGLAQRLEQFASSARAKGSEMGQKMGGFIDMAQDIQKKAATKDMENYVVKRDEQGKIIPPNMTDGTSAYARQRNELEKAAYMSALTKDTREDIARIRAESDGDLQVFNDKIDAYIGSMRQGVDPSIAGLWENTAIDIAHNSRLRVQDENIEAGINGSKEQLMRDLDDAYAEVVRQQHTGDQAAADTALIQAIEIENVIRDTFGPSMDNVLEKTRAKQAKVFTDESYMADVLTRMKKSGITEAQDRLDFLRTQYGKTGKGEYTEQEYNALMDRIQRRLDRERVKGSGSAEQLSIRIKNLQEMHKVTGSFDRAYYNETRRFVDEFGTDAQKEAMNVLDKADEFSLMTPQERASERSRLAEEGVQGIALSALTQLDQQIAAAYQKDPLGYYSTTREAQFSPIPPASSVQERIAFSMQLSSEQGVSPRYWTKSEAESVASFINNQGTSMDFSDTMALLNSMPLDMMVGSAYQLNENGAGWLAMAAQTKNPQVQGAIWSGHEAIKNNIAVELKPTNENDVKRYMAAIDDYFGEAYASSPGSKSAAIEAAKKVYATIRPDGIFDKGDWERAMETVVKTVRHNGSKTIAPPLWDGDDFSFAVENITQAEIESMGGVLYGAGKRGVDRVRNGKLIAVPGGYAVVDKDTGTTLYNNANELFILNPDLLLKERDIPFGGAEVKIEQSDTGTYLYTGKRPF